MRPSRDHTFTRTTEPRSTRVFTILSSRAIAAGSPFSTASVRFGSTAPCAASA